MNMYDKSNWPPGEWDYEVDRVEWKHCNFPCMIVRNYKGALCGYVGISSDHMYYEKLGQFDVKIHGGVSYSAHCNEDLGICHKGNDDHVWWIGFDCGHVNDFVPGDPNDPGIYRNIQYVTEQTNYLAEQLIRL